MHFMFAVCCNFNEITLEIQSCVCMKVIDFTFLYVEFQKIKQNLTLCFTYLVQCMLCKTFITAFCSLQLQQIPEANAVIYSAGNNLGG